MQKHAASTRSMPTVETATFSWIQSHKAHMMRRQPAARQPSLGATVCCMRKRAEDQA